MRPGGFGPEDQHDDEEESDEDGSEDGEVLVVRKAMSGMYRVPVKMPWRRTAPKTAP